MFLFWYGFSGLLPVVVVELDGLEFSSDTSGCSLVILISRLSGNGDMVAVFGIVVLENV